MSDKQPQPAQQVNRPSPLQSLQLATIDAVEMLSSGTLSAQSLAGYLQYAFTQGTRDCLARMKPPAPPSPPPVETPASETPN